MEPLLSTQGADHLMRRRDEPKVRDELARRYLPLAERLASRFRHCGQPMDDLIQAACIGLVKTLNRFDPSRGIAFESYAAPTIMGELKRYLRDHGWSVRMPRDLKERALCVKDAMQELAQTLSRSPTDTELAEHVRLSPDEVREARDAQSAYASISIDAWVNDERDGAPIGETIATDDEALEIAEEWAGCVAHLRKLPRRERLLIQLRFFEDRTQSEIAHELGISQMHVSRLLSQTMRTLRESLGAA